MGTEDGRSVPGTDYDVVVVGAGFGGLNALYRFREQGYRVVVLEMANDVGGTWHWNRYPGARCDIESLEYSYGFDDEIQQAWRWPLRWSEQSDILRYFHFVVDRLDLRKDIRLGTHVRSAEFDDSAGVWTVTTDDGTRLRTRFCVMAVGFLSAPHLPDIPAIDSFDGTLLHSAAWPSEGIELRGKRVGVIGTGASGVQMIPVLAREAEHLTVFQRTPNWCFPIHNEPVDDEYDRYVKESYADLRRREHNEGPGGMVLVDKQMHSPETRGALEFSAEEREAKWEWLWEQGAIFLGFSYSDLMLDLKANQLLREFLETKIRSCVDDQDLATKLIPNHPPWTRRPCGGTGYYETYNRENVTLVATLDDPIERCTSRGIKLVSGEEHELDVLVCATGFDAGGGALLRLNVVGRNGRTLADHWAGGVRTHLGMMTTEFPNFFFVNGVQSPCAFFIPPLLADFQTKFIRKIITAADDAGALTIEPTAEAQTAWVEHLNETVNATLLPMANSWWLGANIPGKERQAVSYPGPMVEYARRCDVAADGLQELMLDGQRHELEAR